MPDVEGKVRLTVLGSGDAFGSGGRAHSAYLVEAPGVTFLIDCGPTVLQSLKKLGRDPGAIDFVLLSHLHGDHFGGVPFLFMEYRWEQRRTRPLAVYGPPDTGRRVHALFAALYEKSAAEPLPFPIEYPELRPDVPRDIGSVRVLPVRTPHAEELLCFAYRIEVAGRTILYSGDTAWNEALVTLAHGADVFLCECSTYETRLDIHLAYPEIAARARDFGCRRLVLTHLGSEPLAHRAELSLECAEDGTTLEL
jgi:ribonuclease BN (tRNA processing enzyme)